VSPSFEDVFDAEFDYVRRSLRRLGVSARDAEDLCQEVFLRVFRALAEYDPDRPLRPWLFAFAYRVAANHRRRARHRLEQLVEQPPEQPAIGDPEAAIVARERTAEVLRALDALSLEKRGILILFDIDGFSAPDIADALAIPVNTVYSRVRQGRADLRAALAKQQHGGRP